MTSFVKLPRSSDGIEVAVNPDWISAVTPIGATLCTIRFMGGDTRYSLVEVALSQDDVLALIASATP